MDKLPSTLYLPNTLENWPWPRRINPHYEEVKVESRSWIHAFKPFDPRSQYAFDRCDFTRLAALSYPDAPKATLLAGSNLMNLFFVIDEYTDVESAPVVRYMANVVMDALKNPEDARPDGEVALGEIARRFWLSSFQTADQAVQRHFLKTFSDYLDSVVHQASDRDIGKYRGIDEYMQNRRDNIGSWPSFVILELDLDVGLEDEVFYHPAIVELGTLATEMLIIDNDLVSYNKEQATGDDRHNILTLVMHHYGVDYHGAISWCTTKHDELKQKFLEQFKHVPSFGPEIDSRVQKYLNGVANWPRGNDSWSFESGRYFGDKGVEYQKTRRVPLLPKVMGYRAQELHRENVMIPLVEELRGATVSLSV